MEETYAPAVEAFEFSATVPGPSLTVFGAVHGNEVCGTQALKKLVGQLEKGQMELLCGHLILVPVCNPLAFVRGVRQVEENLNRVMCQHSAPQTYEQGLANILVPYIERCDWFVDLHSMATSGKPFVFLDYEEANSARLAQWLDTEQIVTGWPQMFEKAGKDVSTTQDCAGRLGKANALIECGYHDASTAPGVAYRAVLNVLKALRMVAGTPTRSHNVRHIRACEVFFREDADARFTEDWQHLDVLRAGQEIALDGNGDSIRAPFNGCILLPHAEAQVGAEWFFLGRDDEPLAF